MKLSSLADTVDDPDGFQDVAADPPDGQFDDTALSAGAGASVKVSRRKNGMANGLG